MKRGAKKTARFKIYQSSYIIIIIIKKGQQCKAGREWYTPYISPKTPAQQYQPIVRKKRKGKRVEDYSRDRAAKANKEALALNTRKTYKHKKSI